MLFNSPAQLQTRKMDDQMRAAIAEARLGLSEVRHTYRFLAGVRWQDHSTGHNKRVHEKKPSLHSEMDCLNNGRIGS